jgi:IS5 family transposase
VKADLLWRFPRTSSFGRPSTPVEVILRMLVVKYLYQWSYEQTEQWVSDSLVLRQFCRIYTAKAPDDTTLLRWANLIQPQTLERLLDQLVALAQQRHVTRGRKLRLDGTVVETNVHYPRRQHPARRQRARARPHHSPRQAYPSRQRRACSHLVPRPLAPRSAGHQGAY